MLLSMSLTGGLLIAVILLLRWLAPALTAPKLEVALWDAVLARLLLPVWIPAPFGLNAVWTPASAPVQETGPDLWTWIWAAGAAATAAVMAFLYWREWNLLRDALPLGADGRRLVEETGIPAGRARILVSDRITTPVAGGIFRPRVILPKAFVSWNRRTAAFVLTHELTHVARRDILQKLLMTAALCLHWFNPLVWLMHRRFDRDLEKSCDEKVVSVLGEDSRCDYAETLVELAARRTSWSICGNGFGRSAIHERIVSMMQHPRISPAGWTAATAVLVCCAAAFAAASPAPTPDLAVLSLAGNQDVVYTVDMDTGQIYGTDGHVVGRFDLDPAAVSVSHVTASAAGSGDGEVQITVRPTSADGTGTLTWTAGNAD